MAQKTIPQLIVRKVERLRKTIEDDGVAVNSLYVFGSYAKGSAHSWSDIDVCVVSPSFGKKIKNPARYLWSKRLTLHDFKLEPIGFNPRDFAESSPLIAEIKKYGIKIK